MNSLRILSGGAAQGLVTHLAPALKSTTGFNLTGEFGAVGGMADKLRHGDPADIIILTTALIARLAEEKLVDPASITNAGRCLQRMRSTFPIQEHRPRESMSRRCFNSLASQTR